MNTHRALLALLAARRNTPVRVDRILAELWPEDPPDSATDNVRTYVSAVRHRLGSQRLRLVTYPGSYLLTLRDDELDAAIFEHRTALARTALAAGHVTEAIDRYHDALRLWRGEPLLDVPSGPGLSLFGHREPLWHLLIDLLYRTGERSSALATYQEARASLARHLGLEPGPDLAKQPGGGNGPRGRQPLPGRPALRRPERARRSGTYRSCRRPRVAAGARTRPQRAARHARREAVVGASRK